MEIKFICKLVAREMDAFFKGGEFVYIFCLCTVCKHSLYALNALTVAVTWLVTYLLLRGML